jgi:uncharacterized protein (DUF305 family)
MSYIDPSRIKPWRLALLAFTAATTGAISLLPGAPGLSQGMGGTGTAGNGAVKDGISQMGMMGYADQNFIIMMIPHHEGAIAMADLALSRAKRSEIRALAKRIKASQTSENAQMRAWYRQWYGQDVPVWKPGAGWGWQGGMGEMMGTGMGIGASGMGMHGGTNLTALSTSKDFDRAFLEQMIPHHQMGVMMASMAQINSQHPELRKLQQAMVRVQSEEIAQMQQWYRQWYQ